MADRFYAPVSYAEPVVELSGSEAHHLKDVLRLSVGQEVILFDGRGTEARARVDALSKRAVALSVLETRSTPQGIAPLILATAVPKGERFRWLVEKATELGIARLIPLNTERSVVHPRETKLDKLRQTVIAACKQCGRADLMEIEAPMSWQDLVDRECREQVVLLAHPAGRRVTAEWAAKLTRPPTMAAIGPEGGFSDAEVEMAVAAGAMLVNLGSNILRVETAAIAMATLLRTIFAKA